MGFDNVNRFIIICSTVNDLIGNVQKSITDSTEDVLYPLNKYEFPFEKVCFLRDYQELNHNFVVLFMYQNNMLFPKDIDSFISKYFFELNTVAHSLEDSNISELYLNDSFQTIFSSLNFKDVELKGVVNQDTDRNTDIIEKLE